MPDPVDVVMNTETRRFEAEVAGELAFAEYRLTGHNIILPHTVVPDALEGRGIGSALAAAALAYARREGLKVIPLCPFIAGYITRHPEWRDVVHERYLEKLGL